MLSVLFYLNFRFDLLSLRVSITNISFAGAFTLIEFMNSRLTAGLKLLNNMIYELISDTVL